MATIPLFLAPIIIPIIIFCYCWQLYDDRKEANMNKQAVAFTRTNEYRNLTQPLRSKVEEPEPPKFSGGSTCDACGEPFSPLRNASGRAVCPHCGQEYSW